jgi:thiol-disulfide isomerase/thioredoxin/sugar lactone lactonase YvrE
LERDPARYAGAVRAPEFPSGLDWIDSAPLQLAGLRGKVVLLDFWTSGCINCIHILPNLHRLHEAFPDRLQIIGVHTPKFPAEKDPDRLALAVERLGIEHPVVSDPDYAVWQSFAVDAWPTLVFVDPEGRVVAKHAGEFDYDRVHSFIAQLLRSPVSPSPAILSEAKDLSRSPLSPKGEGPGVRRKPGPQPFSGSALRFPTKLTLDPTHTRLAIADTGHHRILIATLDGEVETIIGSGESGSEGGSFDSATFRAPQGLAYAPDGQTIIVADTGNHLLRRIDLQNRSVATIAGTGERGFPMANGPARTIALASPADVLWFEDRYLIAMAGTHQIWAFDPGTDRLELVAGTGVESIHDDLFLQATFAQPSGLTSLGHTVYVADAESSAVRALESDTGRVRRIVGRGLFHYGDLDAIGDSVRLQHPQGIVATVEDDAPILYLADTFNNKIKRVDPVRREVVTIAGTGEQGDRDGDALEAEFREPSGIALVDRTLYIADTHNHRIRQLDLDRGRVRTLPLQ